MHVPKGVKGGANVDLVRISFTLNTKYINIRLITSCLGYGAYVGTWEGKGKERKICEVDGSRRII